MKKFYSKYKDTLDTSFYWISLLVLITIPYYFYECTGYFIWGKENISLVFISLAGIAKGFMDTLQFHFDKSKFSHLNKYYWNPEFSWLNKYEEKSRVDFVRKKFKIKIPYLVWKKSGKI